MTSYPGMYWKTGEGYKTCPRTAAQKKRASKKVRAACKASFSGYSRKNRRTRRSRRAAKRY
jgi:hypothetical protein